MRCRHRSSFRHLRGLGCSHIHPEHWYAVDAAANDPARLDEELDSLQAMGVNNIRICAVGENVEEMRAALDHLQAKGMKAVLFLNNAWEWSRGYASYLEEAGEGPVKLPATDGYAAYMQDMARFVMSDKAKELSYDHIRRVVGALKDHEAIYSWEICNEPRCFSTQPEVQWTFVEFIHKSARIIKETDPSHLVTTGSEGIWGCEGEESLCRFVHDCPDIDYITAHIWPYNWSWVSEDTTVEGVDAAIEKTNEYIDRHIAIATDLGKNLVIEEFGYPRDGFSTDKSAATTARDKYYKNIFKRVREQAGNGGPLVGCNFWTWNGDPPQEAEGLNSVYPSDRSTVELIKFYNTKLYQTITVTSPSDRWLICGNAKKELPVDLFCPDGLKEVELALSLVTDLSLMGARDTILVDTLRIASENTSVRVAFPIEGVAPGFYQACLDIGKIHKNGMEYHNAGSFNIGIEPEMISSPQDKPEDFDEFWAATLNELASVAPEVEITPYPECSDSIRSSYYVKYKSLDGALAGGVLCVPNAPGKYPVFIDYMGYGADVYPYYPSANPDRIEFLVSVRGQGIFRDQKQRWIDRALDSRDTYYYRGAFCDAIRAIDFVCDYEKADTSKIFARGESQGGAFTWIAASLSNGRIKAAAPAVPFLSDYRDYYKIVWWPMWEVMDEADKQGLDREEVYAMLRYFDVKNFTDRITCPVYMAFGLQDPVCPPHTNFAGYNQVKSLKQYLCVPTCGHAMWKEKEWESKREEFFKQYMN